jgi:hypothetical protein
LPVSGWKPTMHRNSSTVSGSCVLPKGRMKSAGGETAQGWRVSNMYSQGIGMQCCVGGHVSRMYGQHCLGAWGTTRAVCCRLLP